MNEDDINYPSADPPNNGIITGQLIESDKDQRMSAGSLDELYIQCFLDNPSSKVAALRRAARLSGEDCNTSRARAAQIHQRLARKIEDGLVKNIMAGAVLGYSVTFKICADDTLHPDTRLRAAKDLVAYADKNRLRNKADDDRMRSEIEVEIKQTQERIRALTGNVV